MNGELCGCTDYVWMPWWKYAFIAGALLMMYAVGVAVGAYEERRKHENT